MVISIIDIVPGADTGEQGHTVFQVLRRTLASGDGVTVSFQGIDTATSSFVNAAFVDLLSLYTFDALKLRLKIVRSSRQINDMIKLRLSKEAARLAA